MKPSHPVLSVVVASYGRMKHIQALVESVRVACTSYEIIAVCSDHPDSPKIAWLKEQQDVQVILPDVRGAHRLRSLYYYENLGIKASSGEWVFVTNDDTLLDPCFETALTALSRYNVVLVKGHVGEVGLGARIPIVGTLKRPGETEDSPLYLYDFSAIRRDIYAQIDYLDEKIDWFGKGWDLALKCEFLAKDCRIAHSSQVYVSHTITPEERNPPPCGGDFTYIQNKWNKWCAENPGYSYTCPW